MKASIPELANARVHIMGQVVDFDADGIGEADEGIMRGILGCYPSGMIIGEQNTFPSAVVQHSTAEEDALLAPPPDEAEAEGNPATPQAAETTAAPEGNPAVPVEQQAPPVRKVDLKKLSLKDLKSMAVELGVEAASGKKVDLVQALERFIESI